MAGPFAFYRTTIGKKLVMAVTGLAMILFVVGHMTGNLKFFAGVDARTGLHKLDAYAIFLRQIASDLVGPGTFLWGARIGLLVCLIAHVASAIQLAQINRRARPKNYVMTNYRSANAASLTMRYGGACLFIFVVLHILHFTTGHIHTRGFEEGMVFNNVVLGFQPWYVATLYVVAMAALALHLYHGTWSMFQTMGVTSPAWNNGARTVAKIVSIVLFLGFSAVPLAAHFGGYSLHESPVAIAQLQNR